MGANESAEGSSNRLKGPIWADCHPRSKSCAFLDLVLYQKRSCELSRQGSPPGPTMNTAMFQRLRRETHRNPPVWVSQYFTETPNSNQSSSDVAYASCPIWREGNSERSSSVVNCSSWWHLPHCFLAGSIYFGSEKCMWIRGPAHCESLDGSELTLALQPDK